MAWIVPGHLHRTLAKVGIPTPLVELAGETFTLGDDQISSISISHGGSDPQPGVQPSTCEAVVQVPLWMRTGQNMNVRLAAAAASAIASRTGTVTAARIQDRFSGRIGVQEYDDAAGERLSIRLAAASWSAQLGRIRDVSRWFNAGTGINEVIRYLVATSPALPQIQWQAYGTSWDTLSADVPDGTIQNLLSSVTSDVGQLLRDTRAGKLELWPLHYRRTWAQQELSRQYPITRSQAISPARWSQPNPDMPAKVSARWIGTDGTEVHVSAGGTVDSVVEQHDWTYLRDSGSDDLRTHWAALVNQQWERVMRIPSITIDLLYLLSSDQPYHRGQAGLLLGLNAGDTVGLSGDWYADLRGIHVVSGIDEQITAHSWTLTLSLIPWRIVFGEDSPNVPALVWESATYPWDTETRNWNLQEA